MIQEGGKVVAQVARELGISDNTLYRWMAEYKQDGALAFPGSGQLKADDKAVRDLGWLYLASIMDLYSRKIVGFHMDERMTKELVLTALDRAYSQQRPRGEVLHHSDRGNHNASHDYQVRLRTYKKVTVTITCIESFHSVLKKEFVYLEKNHREGAISRFVIKIVHPTGI